MHVLRVTPGPRGACTAAPPLVTLLLWRCSALCCKQKQRLAAHTGRVGLTLWGLPAKLPGTHVLISLGSEGCLPHRAMPPLVTLLLWRCSGFCSKQKQRLAAHTGRVGLTLWGLPAKLPGTHVLISLGSEGCVPHRAMRKMRQMLNVCTHVYVLASVESLFSSYSVTCLQRRRRVFQAVLWIKSRVVRAVHC